MSGVTYDIITVGGGLGGSALAIAMAEQGARVLILEREVHFKDRVRGEWVAPWGVAEVRELGLSDLLMDDCGHATPWWDQYMGPEQIAHRDFTVTTPQQLASLTFYHPTMQERLLQSAEDAGAEVRRGTVVRTVKTGAPATVGVETDGASEEVQARLVVGADGRNSIVRKLVGFDVQSDPERMLIAGIFFEDLPVADDTNQYVLNPSISQMALIFPQGGGKGRAYIGYNQSVNPHRFQGKEDVPSFVAQCIKTGASEQWYAGARAVGPLATFDGADTWVPLPHKDGVVLIGDAAASSDPTWGQGLSITVRDVRVLRDHLLRNEDWNAACDAYAKAKDKYYGVLHRVTNWLSEFFLEAGPAADARRNQGLPLIAEDETRVPDHPFSGPDLPADETVRRRFFGED